MANERGDQVIEAIDALVGAVEKNSADQQQLVENLHGLRRARQAGTPMTSALANERGPGTMQLLGRVLGRLMEASGTARRALAHAMRAEGTSIPAIARVFGVTHQRVSNILARPHAVPAPVLHEAPSGEAQPSSNGDSGNGSGATPASGAVLKDGDGETQANRV
ncbi:MAG TPA: helix-turn-helix domain-containing protein [Acidimicrobiales bacterium]|nr:helix-turn-helix domain-containing protein [Acidimicrobiales bacterium]